MKGADIARASAREIVAALAERRVTCRVCATSDERVEGEVEAADESFGEITHLVRLPRSWPIGARVEVRRLP